METNEQKLRQLFKNSSDCYADTHWYSDDTVPATKVEGEVIQAITEDKFVELIKKQNVSVFDKIEYMASRGFMAEVVQDGAVEFEFVNDKADYRTGKPSGFGVAWRGCYAFFDKKGKYHWDDVGCFCPEDGGATRAFNELVETFEQLIKDDFIDEKALQDKDLPHYYLSGDKQELDVIMIQTKGNEYITKGSDSLSAGFKTHTFIGILKGIEEFYPGNGNKNISFNQLSLNGYPNKIACGYTDYMWQPQHLYFTSKEEPNDGDLCIVDGGLNRIGVDKFLSHVEYSIRPKKIIATTDKKLNLPLIPFPFIKEYVGQNGNINKVNLKTGRRNIQVGDSTMGEHETITEPIIKHGYVKIINQ